jgi:sec-independent protein translocase protein TatC
MESQDDQKGADARTDEGLSSGQTPPVVPYSEEPGTTAPASSTSSQTDSGTVTATATADSGQSKALARRGSNGGAPPPPPSGGDGGDDEEDGMLRMSFLEHLEELRNRIIKCLAGVGVAFLLCLIFANDLWMIVSEPAADALRGLGIKDPRLAQITPMEVFSTVWVKLPMIASLFVASPWILYQVWAFIAPGLYKKERRWASPFVICSAGLFIAGGLFAYFVAFRYGLAFLLGIGRDIRIQPIVSVTEYFDLFVNVVLGVGLVFELPVLIFFLTLLRIVSPAFLFRHSRYAILAIAIIAAVVTPTPDIFNMMLFCIPMWLLFFVGLFASYLLVLHREKRSFPWRQFLPWIIFGLVVLAGISYFALTKYGFHLVLRWPFLVR